MGGDITPVYATPRITVPALFAPDRRTAKRFLEFFAASLRTDNTGIAEIRAVTDFAQWCDGAEIHAFEDIGPFHGAAYIKGLQQLLADPSVKQYLAAIRRLFDWLVVGQI